ncbi:MAG: hypothetical protein D5R98_09045 [Desulfonatronovibrio sp. MSAO_Bac4]|nr:MAG: hypothetical protein D5R98_09045 [Desulfonatronovibrio sp. MSAO_Bac4]
MKLVHISFRFEYSDDIDFILDKQGITDFVRYSMIEGKGQDGKHFGTQVFPGSFTVVQARVDDDQVKKLFRDLDEFRLRKKSHEHLRAMVLPVEDSLGF